MTDIPSLSTEMVIILNMKIIIEVKLHLSYSEQEVQVYTGLFYKLLIKLLQIKNE